MQLSKSYKQKIKTSLGAGAELGEASINKMFFLVGLKLTSANVDFEVAAGLRSIITTFSVGWGLG